MSDFVGFLVIAAVFLSIAFFADEPTKCTNVWNSLQHKAMGKECPK